MFAFNKMSILMLYDSSSRTPIEASHRQQVSSNAAVGGSVIAPQPQLTHGKFLPPDAKKPLLHGEHSASALAVPLTPWPGVHRQSVTAPAPTLVFLLPGQTVHRVSDLPEEYDPGLQREHSLFLLAGPPATPRPDPNWH